MSILPCKVAHTFDTFNHIFRVTTRTALHSHFDALFRTATP